MAGKATALKLIEGKRESKPEPEPFPAPSVPRCPQGLCKQAQKAWKRLAPILTRRGLLTELDYPALAHLCEIQARLVEIWRLEKLAQNRWTENRDPLHVLECQYMETFRFFANQFGLTPRGRVGLGVGRVGDEEDDGDLLT